MFHFYVGKSHTFKAFESLPISPPFPALAHLLNTLNFIKKFYLNIE